MCINYGDWNQQHVDSLTAWHEDARSPEHCINRRLAGNSRRNLFIYFLNPIRIILINLALSLTRRSCSISRVGHVTEETSSSLWSVTSSRWRASASPSWKICWTRQRRRYDSPDLPNHHRHHHSKRLGFELCRSNALNPSPGCSSNYSILVLAVENHLLVYSRKHIYTALI